MALVPGSRLGPYEVIAQIGEGGMGQVYRARDTKLNRDVALKVLPDAFATDPERLARFNREAQTLASLNHPNIAHIHGLEESTHVRALVMELIEGEDLSRRIARGAIPLDEALPIARQIADALEAAHEHGVIHRDLKPANIKVRPDGTVKVLDFGLAKAFDHGVQSKAVATESPTLSLHETAAGVILGTAAYMSPEQARGRIVDRRADVWAFGAVLYEMLTGRRAFEGDSVSETLAFVITKEPDWTRVPPSVTQSVRNLLARCLTKDHRTRLRDIGEARIALDAITSSAGVAAQPPMAAPSRALLAWRLLPWAVTALAVAALVSSWMATPAESPLQVRRFTLPISPALPAIGGPAGGLALSADGNTLVYSSVTGLVRRRLDSADFDPIRGTEKGAGSPFFSPDGEWLAFFTDNELRKVPVGGGLSVRICGTLPGRGSWGDDGTIAFGSDAGLFLVPSSGGTPTRLASTGTGVATQVHWLPGSEALLVGARGGSVSHAGLGRIDVIDRHTGEATSVIEGGAPQLAPTGDLLFVRAGSIWAVAFDLKQRAVRGDPVAVVESVASTGVPDQVFFAVSQDGTAVYIDASRVDRSLVWIDRTGQTTPALPSKGGFQMPRLSPDGTRVVTTVQNGSESDLWAYEFERGTRRKLTTGGFSRRTAWSPDGTTLAFYSIPEDRSDADLFVVPSAGGEMTRLLDRPGTQFPSSWSPDGGVLLFEETEATSGRRDIWMLPEGGVPQMLMVTKAYERGAVFSPNGRSIAFVSDESGRPEVYVQPFPGSGSKVTVSSNGGLQPVWARNGRELFYRESDWLMKASVEQTPFHISKAQRMFELRGDTYNLDPNFADYDVAADGRFIAARNERRETHEFKIVLNWITELQRARGQQQ